MDNNNDKAWWTKAVIYELYVDKFAGNFLGLMDKLDYLKNLGINTIWILPHYPSPMIDTGYDISDYQAIRKELGNMSDFEKFVSHAHKKGLRVITDMVLNHTSDQHPWFTEARSSKENTKRNWYIWSQTTDKFSQAFVHFAEIKKTNWIYNSATQDYYYATFYPQQPDLNWDNQEVYDAMFKNIEFWLQKGIDGFRLDAISRLIKRDATNCFGLPETHQILKRLRKDIAEKYPNCVLIAESGGWPNEAITFFGNDDECQMVINFPMAVNILASISDKDLSGVEKVLKECDEIGVSNKWALFLTNHDTVDLFFLTNEDKKYRLSNDFNLLQKYGSSENYSFASRLAEICNSDKEKIIWAHNQLFNLGGVPILYYGNEIGMRNLNIIDKPADFREYVRGVFDWSEAQKQMNDPDSIFNGVRKVILDSKDST
jgi:maltose alpha-D-glucosyltransferase / alpha-amylase